MTKLELNLDDICLDFVFYVNQKIEKMYKFEIAQPNIKELLTKPRISSFYWIKLGIRKATEDGNCCILSYKTFTIGYG